MAARNEAEIKALAYRAMVRLAEAYALVRDVAGDIGRELPDEKPEDVTEATEELVLGVVERATMLHMAAVAPDARTLLMALVRGAGGEVVNGDVPRVQALRREPERQYASSGHVGMYL